MPCVAVKLNFKVSDDQKKALLSKLADAVHEVTGKPKQYIMVIVEDNVTMTLGGGDEHCAFLDYRQVNAVNGDTNKKASKAFSQVLEKELKLNPQKVYITFTGFAGDAWGYNGGTF